MKLIKSINLQINPRSAVIPIRKYISSPEILNQERAGSLEMQMRALEIHFIPAGEVSPDKPGDDSTSKRIVHKLRTDVKVFLSVQ